MPPGGIPPNMGIGGGIPQPQQVGQPGGPPGPGFGPMPTGRPPSRTNTPQMQQPGMIQQSPSMGNRPMMPPDAFQMNQQLQNEFSRLPPTAIQQAKIDLGIPLERDNNSLRPDEKVRRFLDGSFGAWY